MNWVASLPVVLPLLVAAGLVAAAPICRRGIADGISVFTAAAATGACAWLMLRSAEGTLVYWFGNWAPRGQAAIGISFVIDPIGAGFAGLAALLVTAALIFSWHYFEAVRTYYHALMMIFLAGMCGFALTGDVFNFFVFFELMGVAAYALTAYKVEEVSALEGGINFAVTNSVGAFLLLFGIALLYGRTGALNMAQIGATLAKQAPDGLVVVALAAICAGLMVKAAVVPFHFWLPDAHAVAPSPVCVLFSGIMVELAVYGVFRVYWTVFHGALVAYEGHVRTVLVGFGAATALLGGFWCYGQRHFKRLLAYSTVTHVGMMLAGAGTLLSRGMAGASLYILGHGFLKAALFMCSGILLHRFASVDELELRGRGRHRPLLAIILTIGGFGLAGFPPFGTFMGKALMEEAAGRVGAEWLAWIFLLASALTGGAVLRFTGSTFLGWGGTMEGEERKWPTEKSDRETRAPGWKRPTVMLTMAAIMVLVPAFSAFWPDLMTKGQAASERFVDQPAYVARVINGTPTGSINASEPVHATGRGLAFGFGSAAAAVLVALQALFCHRIPGLAWAHQRVVRPVLASLQKIQSGHVGDYIVWQMVGVALLGFALALPWLFHWG